MNKDRSNETLDQKIERLVKTIHRCVYQINDTRNTPEIIQTFTRAKAEAERQLAEAQKEKSRLIANENHAVTPSNSMGGEQYKLTSNSTPDNNTANLSAVKSPEKDSGNTISTVGKHDFKMFTLRAAPERSFLVKIEWANRKKTPAILGQGEVLNRFTRTLRDCADSHAARTGNWEKLRISKQFSSLCLYYRAYAFFPRPSQAPLPTLEDMGLQYFVGAVRKRIWEMIGEGVAGLAPE